MCSRKLIALSCGSYYTTTTSVTAIRVRPPGYFTHVSITTPVVSASKNYYIESFLEVPTDFVAAVSEVKPPLRNRFGSETVINL
jgi:hypothetical protein